MWLYWGLCILIVVNFAQAQIDKEVLVFGGNGFMGAEAVVMMLEEGYKPVIVSRGTWRYDAGTRVKPFVKHISCDRQGPCPDEEPDCNVLSQCKELADYVKSLKKIDYVVDFSAFDPEVVLDVMELLSGKIGHYIYISTDNVYEVCKFTNKTVIAETDAVRPDDENLRAELNSKDNYGDEKLAVEEVLVQQKKNGGFDWVALRLPDVIGPRDNNNRWPILQMWVKYFHTINRPLFFPSRFKNLKTSAVFNKDVARVVLKLLDSDKSVYNEVYNLGFDRAFSPKDIPLYISNELNIKSLRFDSNPSNIAFYAYPSVTRGSLDISKAKEKLGFKPTKWVDALSETVEFYESQLPLHEDIYQNVVNVVANQIQDNDARNEFISKTELESKSSGKYI